MKNLTQSEKLFMLFQRGAHFAGRGQHKRTGGGHGQVYVLSLLADAPISQKELLEKLGVRAGSLSELLGKLEHSGFITRTKDENDNRAVNVAITDAGRKFAAEYGDLRSEAAEAMFSALTDEEKTTLIALLEKLHGAWRQEREVNDSERHGHGHHGGFGHGNGPRGGGFHGGRGSGAPGFEHSHTDFHGEPHGEHGERHGGGHSHGAEITDPALKAYLETLNCGECDKNCKLSAPHCGKGAKKQEEAIAEYNKGKE
ncbi:MAG: MarR family transcriptional regulator [Oscillospiraceae bacterium]|jgi:DNA-binding MarR family transcriptional regulator|nr:MarR family transcriptional regulator [Oscillospiraceae bacterium]